MRIKSFTLIEILVASLIFVSVMIVATSSFALVKKSNENAEDLRIASSCARQVEDLIRAQVKSSDFSGRVMAIDFETSATGKKTYKIYPITQKMSTPTKAVNIAGVVLFPGDKEYVMIYKNIDSGDASYYFAQKSGALEINEVKNIDLTDGNMIHSDSCRGITPAAQAGSDRPFKIVLQPRYGAATPAASSSITTSQLGSLVFDVHLDDLIFRYLSGNVDDEAIAAKDSQKTIRLNLEVENSVSSI